VVCRHYRNRRIGEFLKEMDMTEGRSTGFPKIYRAMETNGSPTPLFETDKNNSYFLATLPIHPAFLKDSSNSEENPNVIVEYIKNPDTDKKEEKKGKKNPKIQDFKLDKLTLKLLDLLLSNPEMTREQMSEILGLSRSGIYRKLKILKQSDYIERIGSKKAGTWIVKKTQ